MGPVRPAAVHLLILGGTSRERAAAITANLPPNAAPIALDAAALPFIRPDTGMLPPGPATIVIVDAERAFPHRQTGGNRLVLTQSTYSIQKWADLARPGDRIVMAADRAALFEAAPEALHGRGPWARFDTLYLDRNRPAADAPFDAAPFTSDAVATRLAGAYALESADRRGAICRDVFEGATHTAVPALALASACRELQDPNGARDALDAALGLAPDWEAAHYEDGKFWLASDDIERACRAFERACACMPTFSAAFSNLGATLGELDRPDDALAALRQALVHDPNGYTILNNVGVVSRELGRFDQSETALRQVVAIAPDFVFGHYNLGHTLFLAGRYRDALGAYEEGQRRDPEKNRRQACRLAMMRFATGDIAAAERELWAAADAAPPDEREVLLLEAYEIARALAADHPELDPDGRFVARIAREIA